MLSSPFELLITAYDVSVMMKVHVKTVRRLAREGKFPAPLHLGRCARWRTSDVKAFLDQAGKDVASA